MKRFIGKVRVGVKDKRNGDLIKPYPEELEGEDHEIEEKVRTWYYSQNCHAGEEMLKNYYVDNLTESELKNIDGDNR